MGAMNYKGERISRLSLTLITAIFLCIPTLVFGFQKLTASDAEPLDAFGAAVSVSADVILVGAYDIDPTGIENLGTGSAYLYRYNGATWIEEEKLVPSDGESNDNFGESVAVDGDVALVGARLDDVNGIANAGSAYIYRYNGSNWYEEAKLTASDAAQSDLFGGDDGAVSISGDVALIGAWGKRVSGLSRAGAAYIFRFRHTGTDWLEEAKLTASDAAVLDQFAWSVAIDGDIAVISAPGKTVSGLSRAGAAYLFRFDGTQWVEENKFTAPVLNEHDNFGIRVSISGNVVVVGANSGTYVYRQQGVNWTLEATLQVAGGTVSVDQDVIITGGGANTIVVFRFNGNDWVEEHRLKNPDPDCQAAGFGNDADVSGNIVIVGAATDDHAGMFTGSAYAFDLNNIPDPVLVVVPDVVGLPQADAETIIEAAGISALSLSTSSDTVPAGLVITQTPGAGTELPICSGVLLMVSSGLVGDLNGDGCVSKADYNVLMADIRSNGPKNPEYDLNGDGVINRADARMLVGLFINPRGAPCN